MPSRKPSGEPAAAGARLDQPSDLRPGRPRATRAGLGRIRAAIARRGRGPGGSGTRSAPVGPPVGRSMPRSTAAFAEDAAPSGAHRSNRARAEPPSPARRARRGVGPRETAPRRATRPRSPPAPSIERRPAVARRPRPRVAGRRRRRGPSAPLPRGPPASNDPRPASRAPPPAPSAGARARRKRRALAGAFTHGRRACGGRSASRPRWRPIRGRPSRSPSRPRSAAAGSGPAPAADRPPACGSP